MADRKNEGAESSKKKKSKKRAKSSEENAEEIFEHRSFATGEQVQLLSEDNPDNMQARLGNRVGVRYTARLMETNAVFYTNADERHPFKFVLGGNEVIRGWNLAVCGMHVGGRRRVIIPSLALSTSGEIESAPWNKYATITLPRGSGIVFDLELTKVYN